MTELDLLLIREREHLFVVSELRELSAKRCGLWLAVKAQQEVQKQLNQQKSLHTSKIEASGIDYFTIAAEMARIRAEVRGEK